MSSTAPLSQARATAARKAPASGIAALVTGILGVTAAPLVGSILALIFGYQSRREAMERPDVYSDDLGRVGRVLGWVGVALAALGIFVVLLAFLFLMPV